jgi:hypothetical protein
MKIIYNLKLKTFALLALAMVFVACNDDDTPGQDPSNQKPIARTTVTSLTILEGETGVIPFTLDRATTKPAYFKIQSVGGSATEDEEWTAGTGPLRPDTGNAGDGFEMRIDAGVTSFDIPVNTVLDLDNTEGNENISLRISAAGNRTVLTGPANVNVEVTVEDFDYCLLIEMTDDYGDGWNGGFLTVTDSSGASTDYANQDLDGVFGVAETQTVPVQIPAGAYTITYTEGGGGGGAPGWDSENTFAITGPDGSVVTGGPNPSTGPVTSGTCN